MPSPTLVCRLFRDGVQFCSDLVDLVVGECDHGGVSWMRHIRRLVVAVRGPRWLPGEARSGLKAGRLSPVKPSSAPAVEMRHPSMAYTRPRRAAGTLDLRHHAFALGDFGVVFRDGVSRPSYVVSFETADRWPCSGDFGTNSTYRTDPRLWRIWMLRLTWCRGDYGAGARSSSAGCPSDPDGTG